MSRDIKNRISVAGVSLSECLSPGRFFKNNVAGCDIVGTLQRLQKVDSCPAGFAYNREAETYPSSSLAGDERPPTLTRQHAPSIGLLRYTAVR